MCDFLGGNVIFSLIMRLCNFLELYDFLGGYTIASVVILVSFLGA